MKKIKHRWLCFNCHRLNEPNKRKCIYCRLNKPLDKQALIKRLDNVFSKYIRMRDHNICFTCGKPATDAGHYRSRGHLATRWNEKNVKAQCKGCNRFCNGKLDVFSYKLIKLYGSGIVEKL